ncbi:Helix-turn-helix domain protein [compost metagenome]
MERLRHLRLEAARERLLRAPGLSITEVALEFGFANLGRFASYYRERYGELPSRTGGAGPL